MSTTIHIIGAGISGLTAAYYCHKAGYQVVIHERSDRPGGVLNTKQTDHGLVETAANALVSNACIEALCDDIGVELLSHKQESKSRYIYRDRIRQLPLSIAELIGFVSKLGWNIITGNAKPKTLETTEQWGQRVLGNAASMYLLAPALQGVYAGNFKRMSASLIVGKFFNKQEQRAAKGKLKGSVSPRGGMGELIHTLTDYLQKQGCEFYFNATTLPQPSPQGPVVFCGSVHDAGDYVQAINPTIAKQLLDIEMLGLTTTTVFFDNDSKQAQGFGCLVPKHYGFSTKGVLFSADIFENRSEVRAETWIMDDMLDKTDSEVMDTIEKERRVLFGLDAKPLSLHPNRWQKAFPHYTVELESLLQTDFLTQLESQHLYLHGNYLGKLGLADIIFKASQLPKRIPSQD